AFVNNPEIVLADEPTGNLDSNAGTAILGLLKRTCKEFQTTIIMVTHDARAASYADRVIFLKDGQIVHQIQNNGDRIAVDNLMAIMAHLEI
ncbi:MAG: ABC transporter ATP-binding protein, partial [Anaerolineales bacterium]|nr:ABC transporter ATP-binding protein [Anaerolineales bacterium]